MCACGGEWIVLEPFHHKQCTKQCWVSIQLHNDVHFLLFLLQLSSYSWSIKCLCKGCCNSDGCVWSCMYFTNGIRWVFEPAGFQTWTGIAVYGIIQFLKKQTQEILLDLMCLFGMADTWGLNKIRLRGKGEERLFQNESLCTNYTLTPQLILSRWSQKKFPD